MSARRSCPHRSPVPRLSFCRQRAEAANAAGDGDAQEAVVPLGEPEDGVDFFHENVDEFLPLNDIPEAKALDLKPTLTEKVVPFSEIIIQNFSF